MSRDRRAVFVDTSGFSALAVRRDENLATARLIQASLIGRRTPLGSTNFVLAELPALMLGKVGRTVATRTLLDSDRGNTACADSAPLGSGLGDQPEERQTRYTPFSRGSAESETLHDRP